MSDEIVFAADRGLGWVLLNRPRALNALSHGMCLSLRAQLRAWADDPEIKAVLIRGAGERAFCAGGDIRKLYDEGRAGGDYPYRFYRDEYRCNATVFHFPKPYIALLDGIVMGGGVGVSIHGSHRIVTERTLFAMPETGIGLFPDVGGAYFLPRCPGQLGLYLGLSGARLKAADAIYAGLADAFVPSARLDELAHALAAADLPGKANTSAVIARLAADAGAASLAAHRAVIDRCFAAASVEAILAALEAEGGAWAVATAATLRTKSPTSLKIACRQIRDGATKTFDECLRMEWRIVNRVIRGHDFYEGTRAAVIDKDQKPNWRPISLEAVKQADIAAYFAPLPAGDLALD